MNQYDVIIKKLSDQIAEISKESAIYFSLYISEKEENKNLKEEVEKLKSTDK